VHNQALRNNKKNKNSGSLALFVLQVSLSRRFPETLQDQGKTPYIKLSADSRTSVGITTEEESQVAVPVPSR
jgi:hypothetical protein